MVHLPHRYEVAEGMLGAGQARGAVVQLRLLLSERTAAQAGRRKRWTATERAIRILLARALYECGDLASAEGELRVVLARRDDDAEAAKLMARVLRRSGQYTEAAQWLRRVDELGHDTWVDHAA